MDLSFFQNSPLMFGAAAALVGLCVGSFLNVVIHRLPKMLERDWRAQCLDFLGQEETQPASGRYNLVTPSSSCPSCGHRIRAHENIPVVSWLVLRGKCSACGTRISARYPAVELLTGLLTAYVAFRFGWSAAAFWALVFLWVLIALTFIDADTQLLPDDLTLPLLWLGLMVNSTGVFVDLRSAVFGAVAGYLSLWSVYWGFKLLTGKEGMGFGDFKLLAALGAWLGWQMLPLIIMLSAMVGAVVGGIGILMMGREKGGKIPFGPYLAAAGFIALLWGRQLNEWYLGRVPGGM
jgi:leader peptidase (prepilin peptidase) / N-methyltransferase